MLVPKTNSLSLETYLVIDFTLLTHLVHKNSLNMCWASNHQNIYRNGPRAHFPFTRQLGAVGDQLGRQFLPSVEWCTGQSGAPPDRYCSCPVRDLFRFLVYPTVEPAVPLAHRTLFGAHRTVCLLYTSPSPRDS